MFGCFFCGGQVPDLTVNEQLGFPILCRSRGVSISPEQSDRYFTLVPDTREGRENFN